MPSGRIECICGCMYSGKSEELIRRLRRAVLARTQVAVFKSVLDKRYAEFSIASHSGEQYACHAVTEPGELYALMQGELAGASVIGIDEVQFFPLGIVDVVRQLAAEGRRVIVAGLDMDFRGEPFGPVPQLMAVADEVTKLKAVCVCCQKDATRTQRLVHGRPAAWSDAQILVGGVESYEARCSECHVVPGRPGFLSEVAGLKTVVSR